MNLEKLEEFEHEMLTELRNLRVEDPRGCLKYIVRIITTHQREKNLEQIFYEKFEFLFRKKTDEVIDIICNFFNIPRLYGLRVDDTDSQSDREDSGGSPSGDIDDHYGRRKKTKSSGKIKWNDIARSYYQTNSWDSKDNRYRIPCASYLDKGICMNGDTCGFSHGRAALIKPRLMSLNSVYSGPTNSDCSSFILPKQNPLYDNRPVNGHDTSSVKVDRKRQRNRYKNGHRHRGKRRDRGVIDVSSSESSDCSDSSGCHVAVPGSPPTVYTAPSILESPLWYKELGLVVEASNDNGDAIGPNSSSNHIHSTPRRDSIERSASSSHRSRHEKSSRKHRCCLIVSNIPPELNRIGVLNKHFRKFGTLRNITVRYKGDSKRALVEFRLARDMKTANQSIEAVMGNRFIKTRVYRKKQKRKSKRTKRRNSSSKSYRSRSEIRDDHESEHSDCDNCDRQSSNGDREHRSRKSKKSRNREASMSPCSSKSADIVTSEANNSVDVIGPSQPSNVQQTVLKAEAIVADTHSVNQEMEIDNETYQQTEETQPISEPPIISNMQDEESNDYKLERALNDSDVESIGSDDSFGRRRRFIVVDQRRQNLRSENLKNNKKTKFQRVSNSLNHYKSLLEALILDYKSGDKLKKSILVQKIKDTHSKFMEIKELHRKMSLSLRSADSAVNRDTVNGAIDQLQTSIVDQLNVNSADTEQSPSTVIFIRVPNDVVLYLEQISSVVGSGVVIENFDMVGCSDDGVVYAVTMASRKAAIEAFHSLSAHSVTEQCWSVAMESPENSN